MLFAVADLAGVLTLFKRARSGPFTLMAYEFFTEKCLARVMKHRKLRDPLASSSSHYVLMEVEQAEGDALEAWVAALFEDGVVADGVQAQHASQAAELWALREGISESLSATGFPYKNDIALPIVELETFCASLNQIFDERYPGWEICLFGHIGDGNLHVNVMKPDALEKADFLARTKEADADLFALVKAHHGSISAEHGIGLLKKPYLHFSRSPDELRLMRAVKSALDPLGLLNPGKIFDASMTKTTT
jgi:FAD/FMN-containing dehydrogenase